jgi:hypothetical protein
MTYSERAYFDGDHCAHVAAYFEAARLARIERQWNRSYPQERKVA